MEKNQMRGLAKWSEHMAQACAQTEPGAQAAVPGVSSPGAQPEQAEVPEETANFYSVILNAKHNSSVSDDLVWG